ncbi:hypothetical protein, partial [Pseudomonas sp.]|uniref:hypothetical protein n=1 Tax=Pseudomonas sp. TaxID=306 RepID=UPI0028A8565C
MLAKPFPNRTPAIRQQAASYRIRRDRLGSVFIDNQRSGRDSTKRTTPAPSAGTSLLAKPYPHRTPAIRQQAGSYRIRRDRLGSVFIDKQRSGRDSTKRITPAPSVGASLLAKPYPHRTPAIRQQA